MNDEQEKNIAAETETASPLDSTQPRQLIEDASEDMSRREDDPPSVSLDGYFSRRRLQPQGGGRHIVTMTIMSVLLLSLLVFKDRCGRRLSELMGMKRRDVSIEKKGLNSGHPVRYQPSPDSPGDSF